MVTPLQPPPTALRPLPRRPPPARPRRRERERARGWGRRREGARGSLWEGLAEAVPVPAAGRERGGGARRCPRRGGGCCCCCSALGPPLPQRRRAGAPAGAGGIPGPARLWPCGGSGGAGQGRQRPCGPSGAKAGCRAAAGSRTGTAGLRVPRYVFPGPHAGEGSFSRKQLSVCFLVFFLLVSHEFSRGHTVL